MATITLDWPSSPLTEDQWRRRVEELAIEAESMMRRSENTLQAQARLAIQFVGLQWSTLSPEVIAGSCRASLLLGAPGVILSSAPADQVQEIAERIDAIWEAAQSDPAAAVATVHPPLIDLPPRAADSPSIGRPPREQEQEPTADLLEDNPLAPADLSDMPEAVAPAAAAIEPEPAAPDAPAPPAAAAVDTAGWLNVPEVAELLELADTTIGRWRLDGRLGREGIDWFASGRSFVFNPVRIEAALDRIASERAEREQRPTARRRRPCVADQRPEGWLSVDEAAAQANCSSSRIRRILGAGTIPAELVVRFGYRSRWIDPAAVELLT